MAIHRIRRFKPVQTAKVMAVLYGLMGLIISPIFALVSLVMPKTEGMSFGIGFAIAIPIVYAIIGFIGTLIATAIYNLVAGWVGGIEVEVE